MGMTSSVACLIDEKYKPVIRLAAKRAGRSESAYIRSCILDDLQRRGLLDVDLEIAHEPTGSESDRVFSASVA